MIWRRTDKIKNDLLSMREGHFLLHACPVRTDGSQILLHTVGGEGRIAGDGDGELHAGRVAEALELVQEIVGRLVALAAGDLEQVVDEDVGNIIIARVQAEQEAAQGLVVGQVILVGRDQTNVIVQVKGHGRLCLDADDAAVILLRSGIDHFDQLLGLTGALFTHDESDHRNHSFQ